MSVRSDDSRFINLLLGLGSTSQTVPHSSIRVRDATAISRFAPRQIAIPRPGIFPSFDAIVNVALSGAQFHQAVAVLCMTEEILHTWQSRLNEQTSPAPGLDLLDAYAACPTDWCHFFAVYSYDLIILHGARAALESGRIPLTAAQDLVNAIPGGLMVLA